MGLQRIFDKVFWGSHILTILQLCTARALLEVLLLTTLLLQCILTFNAYENVNFGCLKGTSWAENIGLKSSKVVRRLDFSARAFRSIQSATHIFGCLKGASWARKIGF